jgi:hypothetical protein
VDWIKSYLSRGMSDDNIETDNDASYLERKTLLNGTG